MLKVDLENAANVHKEGSQCQQKCFENNVLDFQAIHTKEIQGPPDEKSQTKNKYKRATLRMGAASLITYYRIKVRLRAIDHDDDGDMVMMMMMTMSSTPNRFYRHHGITVVIADLHKISLGSRFMFPGIGKTQGMYTILAALACRR